MPIRTSISRPDLPLSTEAQAAADRIASDARDTGVVPGGVLLVHSSLSAMGHVPGGAETVIRGLLQALGPEGTLLMPALSYERVTEKNPTFDVLRTPSNVGAIPEAFRTRPGTRRSLHPTHSVCGVGPRTVELLDGHDRDTTPCGESSPFRKLRDVGGQILMLGCGLRPNTSMHAIEELVVPPYLFGSPLTYTLVYADRTSVEKTYTTHGFDGWTQRYDRVAEVLVAPGLRLGRILEAQVHLLQAQALWDAVHAAMVQDPLRFVDRVVQEISSRNRRESPMPERVRMALIGCGNMGRNHLRDILKQQDTTEIVALCDIAPEAIEKAAEIFDQAGVPMPPSEPRLDRLLANHALDAVFIVTPHAVHFSQARACLEAGLDVLLEKPMVMNAQEALSLIEARDRTGKLLTVAFNGSLSPEIRESVRLLRSGELGKILSISATIWQRWGPGTSGKWRQVPEISGGGFMIDTGAHMLNTVADLAGERFVEVAAYTDNYGRPVETLAAVIARLASGALVTFHGCGETVQSCDSDIRVFCTEAILRTGAWGRWLELQRQGDTGFHPVQLPPSLGAWQQFVAVRNGEFPNPSPPEVGLRMARLYDAILASAARHGAPVSCSD